MSRAPTHTVDSAPAQTTDALKRIEDRFGSIPQLFGAMAHAPALVQMWSNADATLAEGSSLDAKQRIAIALAVSAENECDYDQALYTAAASEGGWTEDECVAIRDGALDDAKLSPLLALVRESIANEGFVTDTAWDAAIEAGWSDTEILEAFAEGMSAMVTNYFNHLVDTDIDLPKPRGIT